MTERETLLLRGIAGNMATGYWWKRNVGEELEENKLSASDIDLNVPRKKN